MIEQSKNLMVQTGAAWVLWLLIALSIVSVTVAIDRAREFWRQRDDVEALARELHRLLSLGDPERARRRLLQSNSLAAVAVLAGLAQWGRDAAAVKQSMAAAVGLGRARLQRRLLFLGTVGNNAPFVGLLGTVIGVVGAFEELGRSEQVAGVAELAPERVMATLAEALVVTAVGLLVAIPAVALFNYFHARLSAAVADAETLGHVLLAHVEGLESPAAGKEK